MRIEKKCNLIKTLEKRQTLPDLIKVVGKDENRNEIIEYHSGEK